MYLKQLYSLLLFVVIAALPCKAQDFDRSLFYKVLSQDNQTDIDEQLTAVKRSAIKEKGAYEGALLMKKAGGLKKPKDKLNSFKAGHAKLEAAITGDNDNMEYRFLRVLIQEHAPKILGYKKDMAADSKLIHTNFNQLSSLLKQVITDYSKTSKTIKIPIHN